MNPLMRHLCRVPSARVPTKRLCMASISQTRFSFGSTGANPYLQSAHQQLQLTRKLDFMEEPNFDEQPFPIRTVQHPLHANDWVLPQTTDMGTSRSSNFFRAIKSHHDTSVDMYLVDGSATAVACGVAHVGLPHSDAFFEEVDYVAQSATLNGVVGLLPLQFNLCNDQFSPVLRDGLFTRTVLDAAIFLDHQTKGFFGFEQYLDAMSTSVDFSDELQWQPEEMTMLHPLLLLLNKQEPNRKRNQVRLSVHKLEHKEHGAVQRLWGKERPSITIPYRVLDEQNNFDPVAFQIIATDEFVTDYTIKRLLLLGQQIEYFFALERS